MAPVKQQKRSGKKSGSLDRSPVKRTLLSYGSCPRYTKSRAELLKNLMYDVAPYDEEQQARAFLSTDAGVAFLKKAFAKGIWKELDFSSACGDVMLSMVILKNEEILSHALEHVEAGDDLVEFITFIRERCHPRTVEEFGLDW